MQHKLRVHVLTVCKRPTQVSFLYITVFLTPEACTAAQIAINNNGTVACKGCHNIFFSLIYDKQHLLQAHSVLKSNWQAQHQIRTSDSQLEQPLPHLNSQFTPLEL